MGHNLYWPDLLKGIHTMATNNALSAIDAAISAEMAAIDASRKQQDLVNIHYPGVKDHHGEDLTIKQAIKSLQDRQKYLEQTTVIAETFNAFPYDGAFALKTVLTRIYGWAQQKGTPGFFGETPPVLIKVEIAPGVHADVPWGRIGLPNADGGYLDTGADKKDGVFKFMVRAEVLRRDEHIVRKVFDQLRQELKENSIYRGRAIKIKFKDDHGKPIEMPQPEFIDTAKVDPGQLTYSEAVMEQVEVNLFTPIQRVRDCIADGESVKRGVLLAGTYGTGKTLAAMVAARYAVDVGVTYVYVPRADQLGDALQFAKQYQSPAAMVFCEDIDRSLSGDERTVAIDDIINMMDGLDTKHANIITVLTTNHLENINPAALRTGRLDSIIEITPPDAVAVQRLVRHYGGKAIDKSTDLTEVGKELAGFIPADIAEVVKRARLAQRKFQPAGLPVTNLSAEALLASAKSMTAQRRILQDRMAPKIAPITVDSVLEALVQRVVDTKVEDSPTKVKELHAHIMD